MKRRGARRKGISAGSAGSVIAIGAALLGVVGLKCAPDKLLKGIFPSSTGKSNIRVGPPANTGHAPPPKGDTASNRPPAPRPPAGTPPPPSIHLAMGTPTGGNPTEELLLLKPQYALSYNKSREVPSWVSWNLNETYFGDVPRFRGKFLPDEALPPGVYRVRDQDYAGSGFDRGHMVRSEERTRTAEDNKATFLLTNVLPQRHDLNAGPWLRLEDYLQDLAQKEHRELFIMAGGVFKKSPETIGHGVAMPEQCFKIAVVLDRGKGAADVTPESRVIAVLMPNITGILGEEWGQYRTTVREIERRTGFDFLPAVPEAIQQVIESRVDEGPVRER